MIAKVMYTVTVTSLQNFDTQIPLCHLANPLVSSHPLVESPVLSPFSEAGPYHQNMDVLHGWVHPGVLVVYQGTLFQKRAFVSQIHSFLIPTSVADSTKNPFSFDCIILFFPLLSQSLDDTYIAELANHAVGSFSPVCCVAGGMYSQEVLKVVQRSGRPMVNTFVYDALEESKGYCECLTV